MCAADGGAKATHQGGRELSRPIRLGLIGCGLAARKLHWPALEKLKHKFRLVVVCNHTEPKARTFAELAGGVEYVLDYRELLAREDVDAVDIVLPIHLNARVARESLAAGKHVLLEKPLAANAREAQALVRAAAKSDRVAMVAENFRYRPTFLRLGKLLDRSAIGNVHGVQWNVFHNVTPQNNPYAKTQWRLDHQYPGGFLTDGGVHNVHAVRMLFGEIAEVTARAWSVNRAIGELDTMTMSFATERGVRGTFNVSFSTRGFRESRLLVLGSKGSIIVTGNRIELLREGKPAKIEEIEDDGGYAGEFEDFFRAVRRGAAPKVTFEEAERDLAVMLAALRTAKAGRTIN